MFFQGKSLVLEVSASWRTGLEPKRGPVGRTEVQNSHLLSFTDISDLEEILQIIFVKERGEKDSPSLPSKGPALLREAVREEE